MNYYVQEVQMNEGNRRTAGVKARDDLDVIFEQIGIQSVSIISNDDQREHYGKIKKFTTHFSIVSEWKKKLAFLQKGDCLIVQFPIIGHSIFQANIIKKLEKRGVKVILIIHDLELLRAAKREDVSSSKKLRLKLEEMDTLRACSKIIVHNQKMKKYIYEQGIPEEKMESLDIFDYIIPEFDAEKAAERKLDKDAPVIVAGTLRKHKAQYVYLLKDSYSYNLYGVGYEGVQNDEIVYHGSFPPDDLPYVMNGSFGLVWDGVAINTCSGIYGDYLKINNPHKTSLYLASGIPVIIWAQAALADFVRENQCGIIVESLYDLKTVISDLSEEQYEKLKENAGRVGERLRSGYYTRKAVEKCLR